MPDPLSSVATIAQNLPTLGGIASGIAQGVSGLLTNKWNENLVQRQMDFQERMSSTAYQRATADMRKAGINPMLAYMQGGASSPGGGAAKMDDVMGPAVSSARQGLMQKAQLELITKQGAKLDADTALAGAQAALSGQQAMTEEQRRALMIAQAGEVGIRARLQGLGIPEAENKASMQRTWFGKVLPYAEPIMGAIGTAAGLGVPGLRIPSLFRGRGVAPEVGTVPYGRYEVNRNWNALPSARRLNP